LLTYIGNSAIKLVAVTPVVVMLDIQLAFSPRSASQILVSSAANAVDNVNTLIELTRAIRIFLNILLIR
jgi:hypothetical protein